MSVRNRIAMFEQTAAKEGASPEDRGRSPGVSSLASGSDSPRPLSKVRTSFVAIEKDGRIGLQRNPSETSSSFSMRKLSSDPEAASTILQETTRTNVSSPESLRPSFNRSGPSSSALSNSSLQDTGATIAGELGASTGQNPKPPSPAKPSPSSAPISGPAPTGLSGPRGTSGPEKGLAESPQITQAPKKPQGQGSNLGRPNQAQSEKEDQDQAVRDKAQSKNGPGSKGPLNQRSDSSGPGAGAGRGAVPKALNGADKAKASTPALANGKATTPSSQPKPASKTTEVSAKRSKTPPLDKKPTAEKKTTPKSVSPAGFVKPRPKSPTRPVKLPPSLTTHTAASGSRTKTGATPEQPVTKPRSTSRSSQPGKSLQRSSSVAGRQRPSIGPPPKQVAKDHPVPKREAKVDEGFLARMMRPTQASASKAAEKVPTTPPRKTPTLSRKPSSAKMGAARKPVSKTTSTASSSVVSPITSVAPTPAAKEVAPKVEKTASADEAIKVAKEMEGTVPLDVPQEKAASPKIPKTPEREPVIVEEEEEPEEVSANTTEKTEEAPKAFSKMEDALNALGNKEGTPSEVEIPTASEAPEEASQEPEVEKADAPLANGDHKAEVSVEDTKAEVANGAANGAPKVQELDDEETW